MARIKEETLNDRGTDRSSGPSRCPRAARCAGLSRRAPSSSGRDRPWTWPWGGGRGAVPLLLAFFLFSSASHKVRTIVLNDGLKGDSPEVASVARLAGRGSSGVRVAG